MDRGRIDRSLGLARLIPVVAEDRHHRLMAIRVAQVLVDALDHGQRAVAEDLGDDQGVQSM